MRVPTIKYLKRLGYEVKGDLSLSLSSEVFDFIKFEGNKVTCHIRFNFHESDDKRDKIRSSTTVHKFRINPNRVLKSVDRQTVLTDIRDDYRVSTSLSVFSDCSTLLFQDNNRVHCCSGDGTIVNKEKTIYIDPFVLYVLKGFVFNEGKELIFELKENGYISVDFQDKNLIFLNSAEVKEMNHCDMLNQLNDEIIIKKIKTSIDSFNIAVNKEMTNVETATAILNNDFPINDSFLKSALSLFNGDIEVDFYDSMISITDMNQKIYIAGLSK